MMIGPQWKWGHGLRSLNGPSLITPQQWARTPQKRPHDEWGNPRFEAFLALPSKFSFSHSAPACAAANGAADGRWLRGGGGGARNTVRACCACVHVRCPSTAALRAHSEFATNHRHSSSYKRVSAFVSFAGILQPKHFISNAHHNDIYPQPQATHPGPTLLLLTVNYPLELQQQLIRTRRKS